MRLVLAAALALTAGCGVTWSIPARLRHVAMIPREAPMLRIVVQGADHDDVAHVERVLRARLTELHRRFELVSYAEATRARPDEPGAVGVVIDVAFAEGGEALPPILGTRGCLGRGPCGMDGQPRLGRVLDFAGIAALHVVDGATGRVVGELPIDDVEEGYGGNGGQMYGAPTLPGMLDPLPDLAARLRVREQLATAIVDRLVGYEESTELVLVRVDDDAIAERARAHDLAGARELVEAHLASVTAPEQRARLLFDEAQIVRAGIPEDATETDVMQRLAQAHALASEALASYTSDGRFVACDAEIARELAAHSVLGALRGPAPTEPIESAIVPPPP
jgi:hypothetical protein